MANLIITIISIALVAIAAIVGIFYGGTAFTQHRINAMANQITSALAQEAAAGSLYRANYGFGSVCDLNKAYGNYNICASQQGDIITNWGPLGVDPGKYFYPFDYFPGQKNTDWGFGRTFENRGMGYVLLDNVTYWVYTGFGYDGQSDTLGLIITELTGINGSQVTVNSTDTLVQVCQQINKPLGTLPIWTGTTFNSTYQLPQNTAGPAYGTLAFPGDPDGSWNMSGNNIVVPANVCYLVDYGSGVYGVAYYIRL